MQINRGFGSQKLSIEAFKKAQIVFKILKVLLKMICYTCFVGFVSDMLRKKSTFFFKKDFQYLNAK